METKIITIHFAKTRTRTFKSKKKQTKWTKNLSHDWCQLHKCIIKLLYNFASTIIIIIIIIIELANSGELNLNYNYSKN